MVLVFLHILTNLSACVCVFLHASFGVGVLLNKTKKICQPTHTHTRTLHQRNKKPAKKSSGLFFVVYFALSARVRFFVAPLVGSRRLFLQTICVFLTVAFCALTHKTEWFHQQHNKNKPAFQPRSKTKPTTTKIYPYTGPNAGSNAHNG